MITELNEKFQSQSEIGNVEVVKPVESDIKEEDEAVVVQTGSEIFHLA
jgi:hypothetical protein